jgi:uncharacterized protein YndB with AHSA1/START domain
MPSTGTLQVTTPTEREIVMTRVFKAPRTLVYDAFTKPELLKKWFRCRGYSLTVCEVDFKVGGAWRFVFAHPDGKAMTMSGVYKEILAPERDVHTECMEGYPGESLVTGVFTESDGQTTLTLNCLYESKEIRDMVIQTGMEHGAAETYDNLDEYLATVG